MQTLLERYIAVGTEFARKLWGTNFVWYACVIMHITQV